MLYPEVGNIQKQKMDNQPNENHDQFDLVVEKLESATNILVTVKSNPSVDQLASLIGLTLSLNKIGKHATAVFSGEVPSVLEFLKPDDTIETNTNSLRDFIIAIDKSKADKLRYKVEGDVVRIFITPYKTSLSDKDLEFSQGDFNIDAIVGLGIHDKSDLDKAIVAHGKILHDATVISITNDKRSELGSVLWVDDKSSSLCEMVADVARELDKDIFDEQISTSFLTGIVAETARFSNGKTTPHAMSVAGLLMAGGANAQLISTKLETQKKAPKKDKTEEDSSGDQEVKDDGTLTIKHVEKSKKQDEKPVKEESIDLEEETDDIHIDQDGKLQKIEELKKLKEEKEEDDSKDSAFIKEPPTFTGQLTANTNSPDSQLEPSSDPLSSTQAQANRPIMSRPARVSAKKEEPVEDTEKTLTEIENSLKPTDELELSEDKPEGATADQARDAIDQARLETVRPEPKQTIGSTPLDLDVQGLNSDQEVQSSVDNSSSPPPPVPPPMMPPA